MDNGGKQSDDIMKVLNQEQIKWVDLQTLADQNLGGHELMERAVHQLYNHIKRYEWYDSLRPICIFAGSGNNGGDGIGLARLFGEEGGDVRLYYCDYGPPTIENLKMREKVPKRKYVRMQSIESTDDLPLLPPDAIIIDALFGSGISRPISGLWLEVVQHINESGCTVVSLDLPSGLHPDRKMEGANSVFADYTLTIGQPKFTFFLPQLESVLGKWEIVDIRLSEEAIEQCETDFYYINRAFILSVARLGRRKFSHKGTYGHALLINGSYGKMGAAILAAKACLRSGVGLLTCHVPGIGYPIMQTSVPESMLSVDENEFYFQSRLDLEKYDAIGIGSGIDDNDGVSEALYHVIKSAKVPLIMDADALNILARHPGWMASLPENTILTPHPGEFKRLFGEWADDWEKIDRQRSLSVQYKIIIVLKGANTSVSTPDGKIYFNSTGNPGMATAGSGDTLTGIITALAAQGLEPRKAAWLGVYIHGLAGDIAIRESSQISLMSSDITNHLGIAYRATFGL